MVKVGSLFAGIGGFDLAARWMGWETIWFSEIDPYASAVLAKHWPGVPNLGDITRIDWSGVERPDLLCGGFPCQDTSHAGRRAELDGSRSGLWWEYHRAICELGPRYTVVENPTGLLDRGFGAVLGSLSEIGYDAEWTTLSACAVGAPHTRERVFLVAHPKGQRPGQLWRSQRQTGGAAQGHLHRTPPEPPCKRVADGIPNRVDRLVALGNSVHPGCVFRIFQAIERAEMSVGEHDGKDAA